MCFDAKENLEVLMGQIGSRAEMLQGSHQGACLFGFSFMSN